MEMIGIPSEEDFRRWIREELQKIFDTQMPNIVVPIEQDEPLISRIDVAKKLTISLVTLNAWVKTGLPAHKQEGRVYFLMSEVKEYIIRKKARRLFRDTVLLPDTP